MIESINRDNVKIKNETLDELFPKLNLYLKYCKFNCNIKLQYSKSLFELLDYDTDDLQNIYIKDAEQKPVKQQK